MFELVRDGGAGKLVIRPRARRADTGKLLAGAGVVLAVAVIPLTLWAAANAIYLSGLAGFMLLIGFAMALSGGRVVVDRVNRRALMSRGRRLPFRNVAQVHLAMFSRQQRTDDDRDDDVAYRVSLVTQEATGEVPATVRGRTTLEAIRRKIGGSLSGQTLMIAELSDDLMAWHLAERLSRVIGVPMLDLCGDQMVERSPSELDLPLGTRLARSNFEAQDPGPPVAPVRELSVEQHQIFHWPRAELARAAVMALPAVVTGLVAWFAFAEKIPRVGWPMAVLACLLLLPALGKLLGPRQHALELDLEGVRVRTHTFFPVTYRIPLARLELVRVDAQGKPGLSLVSDERIVRLPMPEPAAQWLKARIEIFVVGKPHA